MRITKAWMRETKRKIIEGQAILCAIAGQGQDALNAEFTRRHPHYVGAPPASPMECLRQLLYDDLERIIPGVLTD